ncbi:AraC family transcriptional regulator, partial [Campylobacter jejuni]
MKTASARGVRSGNRRVETFSIPPSAIAGFGLSIERLCERAGVAPSTNWDTGEFFRLWQAVEAELDDRSAGLRFGADGIARGYGIPSIV